MKRKENTPTDDKIVPRHSKEVEKVANQILWYGIGAAVICTIIALVL